MTSPFRIAIIGCGKIAKSHVRACLTSAGVEIAALVEPQTKHAEQLSSEFGLGAQIYASVGELPDNLAGAIVAVPNHLHRTIADQCADQGLHVLMEKPLATSLDEGEAVCRRFEDANLVLAVGFVTRHDPGIDFFKQLLQENYFGTISNFVYQYGTRGGWAPVSAYNLDRETTGGGVLVVTGTHFIDRMLYWFGYPKQLSLEHDSQGGPEANAVCNFEFDFNGEPLVGQARFSKTISLPAGFAMQTEKGIVTVSESNSYLASLYPNGQPHLKNQIVPSKQPAAGIDRFSSQVIDFVNACRNLSVPKVTGRQGLDSVRLVEELYKAESLVSTV